MCVCLADMCVESSNVNGDAEAGFRMCLSDVRCVLCKKVVSGWKMEEEEEVEAALQMVLCVRKEKSSLL